ncbi:hypothetical protein SDC9_177347 [bioreactor metagenome]|uniref:Uncharacterized protein n=1 Tax=bioreactor metagenome TaxID=1076179 RepID=A0A645H224_9ZZZZ
MNSRVAKGVEPQCAPQTIEGCISAEQPGRGAGQRDQQQDEGNISAALLQGLNGVGAKLVKC